jgi:hypothetical protein
VAIPHLVFQVVKLERYTAFIHLHAFMTVPHLVQAQPFEHFMMQSRANIALVIQPVSA